MSAFTRRRALTPLAARSLGVAINEFIQDWFICSGRMADQNQILAALGACMADQILQNPDKQVEEQLLERTFMCVAKAMDAEHARRRADEPTIEKH